MATNSVTGYLWQVGGFFEYKQSNNDDIPECLFSLNTVRGITIDGPPPSEGKPDTTCKMFTLIFELLRMINFTFGETIKFGRT